LVCCRCRPRQINPRNSVCTSFGARQFSVGVINEFCFNIPMKFLRTTVLTILLLVILSIPALAQTKIGTVDLRKLFDGYWKTKQAQSVLADRQAQLNKDIKGMSDDLKKSGEEYQKLLEQANDQAISADQRDKRKLAVADKLKQLQDSKTALDQFERQAQVTLQEQQMRMRDSLLGEIKAVVTVKAKSAGYSLVVDAAAETANATTAVIYSSGENDLTDEVLKQLNASAPIDLTKPVVSTAVPPLVGTNSLKKVNSH
jgi:Skp family chaperone for outer membrane proteins